MLKSVTLNEKKNQHYTITTKIFIAYKFERSPAPFMGISICTTSDKIKWRAVCKFLLKRSA